MNKFLDALAKEANVSTTENGAKTNLSSLDPLLDWFALGGATRNNLTLGLDLFQKAFAFAPLEAVKILFYFRDIRGGQGERALFRTCLKWLDEIYPEVVNKNLWLVGEFGRFDDLLALPAVRIAPLIRSQLAADKVLDNPSLLAKWLPSENASSFKTKAKAMEIRKALSLSPQGYRKLLSTLRKKIKLVEHNLTNRNYATLEYPKVPSQAMLKYHKAFERNDTERFLNFKEAVKTKKDKVNTATLYPYQLYDKATTGHNVDLLWDNLPNYLNQEANQKAIVVADVSGSMCGRPMSVAVSLALYFAERSEGAFKNHFITFSNQPSLTAIYGDTLVDKINSIESSHWGMSTNLKAVFDLILKTAVEEKMDNKDLPDIIYIISDMEFDRCSSPQKTNFQKIDEMYQEAGFVRPQLVFWNVDARNKNLPATKYDTKVSMVSGFSPTLFKIVTANVSPREMLQKVLNDERYNKIAI